MSEQLDPKKVSLYEAAISLADHLVANQALAADAPRMLRNVFESRGPEAADAVNKHTWPLANLMSAVQEHLVYRALNAIAESHRAAGRLDQAKLALDHADIADFRSGVFFRVAVENIDLDVYLPELAERQSH